MPATVETLRSSARTDSGWGGDGKGQEPDDGGEGRDPEKWNYCFLMRKFGEGLSNWINTSREPAAMELRQALFKSFFDPRRVETEVWKSSPGRISLDLTFSPKKPQEENFRRIFDELKFALAGCAGFAEVLGHEGSLPVYLLDRGHVWEFATRGAHARLEYERMSEQTAFNTYLYHNDNRQELELELSTELHKIYPTAEGFSLQHTFVDSLDAHGPYYRGSIHYRYHIQRAV